MPNHLHYGDNLAVLRDSIATASVDLVYLDPPFNSNASYNVLFKGPSGNDSAAQIEAFDDTWHWTDSAEDAFQDVRRSGNAAAAEMLTAMRSFLGENDMMAYLAMMAVRLLELHRVLKPTGSLYLHCDPTASHYLKILLDAVFGAFQFKNEVVWERTFPKGHAYTRFASNHDIILFYKGLGENAWLQQYHIHSKKYLEKYSLIEEGTGSRFQARSLINPNSDRPNLTYEYHGHHRVWRWTRERMLRAERQGLIYFPRGNGIPREKRYLDEQEGVPISDVWTDIPPLNSMAVERLGYPTQKPVALLERIIDASSNPGDVVLDPFCGCGTTVHAAQNLGRQWIGIDVTHLAIGLIEKRLRDAFPDVSFITHGTPQDLSGARDLANRGREDKSYYFEFEKWALSLIAAQPDNLSKKGADRGIDGNVWFGKTSRAIVSVKAGDTINVGMIRDLRGVIEREKAAICASATAPSSSPPAATTPSSAPPARRPRTGRASSNSDMAAVWKTRPAFRRRLA